MARYNSVYSGPFTEQTVQAVEGNAAAATLPGCGVVWNAGELALSGATTVGKIMIAQENYIAQLDPDTAWTQDTRMIAIDPLPGQIIAIRVATGNNVAKGAALSPAANGLFALSAAEDKIFAYAEEAYNNTSGDSQLVRVRVSQGYLAAA